MNIVTKHLVKVILLNILLITRTYPIPVEHSIQNGWDFTTAITRLNCGTSIGPFSSTRCNPALFPFILTEQVDLNVMLKSDGESIDNGEQMIFDSISKKFLLKIFNEVPFNSFAFSSAFNFHNKYFRASYTPYYLQADIFVFNPAFPELALNIINQRTLSIASGIDLTPYIKDFSGNKLSVGGEIRRSERSAANQNITFSSLAVNSNTEQSITFNETKDINFDLGVFFKSHYNFLPALSFQTKNILSSSEVTQNDITSPKKLVSIFSFETFSYLSLGFGHHTVYGEFEFSFGFPINKILGPIYWDSKSLYLGYSLGSIATKLSISKYHQSLGIITESSTISLGIIYTQEQPTHGMYDISEKNVILSAGIKI